MQKSLFVILICTSMGTKAQQIDSIYVNLYTDSLKKGTYNYINIDGLLPNGRYLPLDTTHLSFSSSAGRFIGNNLVLEPDCKDEKVAIHVKLRNTGTSKDFVMYIKKKEDNERLPTEEELFRQTDPPARKKKKQP